MNEATKDQLLSDLTRIVLRFFPNTGAANERAPREALDRELREWGAKIAIHYVDRYSDEFNGYLDGFEKDQIRKGFGL